MKRHMSWQKKVIIQKSKVYISNSLCLYYLCLWGKCKDQQKKGNTAIFFCLGAVVIIRVTENSPTLKRLYRMPHEIQMDCQKPSSAPLTFWMGCFAKELVIFNAGYWGEVKSINCLKNFTPHWRFLKKFGSTSPKFP